MGFARSGRSMSGRWGDWQGKWERLIADSKRAVDSGNLPFPNDAQLDLLKAALLPADQAAPAWRRWKCRGVRLDTVGDVSVRLFHRLWANRDAAAIEAEDRALLKGVYRRSFADNVSKLTSALDATQILVDAGIPVLFLKGAALIATCDATLGLRRIGDVDILVPELEAERAAALLTATGCQATYETYQEAYASHVHAWTCKTPAGYNVDLHWRAFKPAGDDSPMFETAQEATLLGRSVLVPSATESLLVAVANAFWLNGPPMRWIADSLLLLETGPIDWDVVLQRANRPGLMPGLAAGLGYLAGEFGAAVPTTVLDELHRRQLSWQARVAYWAATKGTFPNLVQFEAARAHRLHFPAQRMNRDMTYQTLRAVIRSVVLLALRFSNRLSTQARNRRLGRLGLRR